MRAPLLALILSLSLGTGCAVIAASTGGAVVRGGVGALAEDPAAADLHAVLQDPALQDAARRLAEATATGALDGLSDSEREAILQTRSLAFVEALTPVLSRAISAELGPVVRAELVAAVTETVHSLASEPERANLQAFSAAISRAVVDTIAARMWASVDREAGPATQKYLEGYLGPALRTVLERDVGPTLADRLDPTVALLVRTATHEALAELNDALGGELGEKLRESQDSTLDGVNALIEAREKAALAWAKSFGLLAGLGALVAGVLGWRLWKSVHAANQSREAMAMLATMIKLQSQEDPAAKDLVRRIRRDSKDTPAGRTLKDFLDQRRELRVEVDEESGEQP